MTIKWEPRDESEHALRAKLMYMCVETQHVRKMKNSYEIQSGGTTQTPSIIHTRTRAYPADALYQRLSSSDHHAGVQREVHGRGEEGRRREEGK